jgi:hypothetical protein
LHLPEIAEEARFPQPHKHAIHAQEEAHQQIPAVGHHPHLGMIPKT